MSDKQIDTVGFEFVISERMWRAEFLFQKFDCSPNCWHVHAMLATDRSENVSFDEINKRECDRRRRCWLNHRLKEPPFSIATVRHAGNPGTQRRPRHEQIMRGLCDSIRWQFSNVLLLHCGDPFCIFCRNLHFSTETALKSKSGPQMKFAAILESSWWLICFRQGYGATSSR